MKKSTNEMIIELEHCIEQVKEKIAYEQERFSKEMRVKREGLGHGLREWARMLNISAPYLSDIEKGRRNAPLHLRKKMEAIK
jgi:predicted transcriptional regulator